MNDRYDPNLILGYVEDELIAADRARVDAMLAEDPALASLVADLRRDRQRLREAAPVEPPADLAGGAMAAIERQMLFDDEAEPVSIGGGATAPRRFRLAPLLTYGGIAAVLALTLTVVFQSLQSDQAADTPLAMNEAPRDGLSLAEATVEAQRKAMRESAETDTLAQADREPAMAAETPRESMSDTAEEPHPTAALADSIDPKAGADALAAVEPEAAPSTTESLDESLAMLEAPRDESVTRPGRARAQPHAETSGPDTLGRGSAAPPPATPAPTPAAREVVAVGSASGAVARTDSPSAEPAVLALAESGLAGDLFADEGFSRLDQAASNRVTPNQLVLANQTSLGGDRSSQRFALNVLTDEPDTAVQKLNDWAVDNSIAVVPVHATDPVPAGDAAAKPEDERVTDNALDQQTLGSKLQDDRRDGTDLRLSRQVAEKSGGSSAPQRLQLFVSPQQINELTALLSDGQANTTAPPQVVPLQPWMNWQAPLQQAQIEVIIEPRPTSAE